MTRKALCVGINYVGTSAELRGCVRDAQDWAHVLGDRSYNTLDTHEQDATKEGILRDLAWLVEDARWGDRLVFTFSGHGTNVRDLDGDEADGRDEALVSVDMRTITDDDIHAVVGGIPRGVRLTIISDSCHSGTVSRFMLRGKVAGFERVEGQSRYLDPSQVTVESSPPRRRSLLTAKPMLLSGCTDHEVSYDAYINGAYRGAMTAAALATLPAATSMADWRKRTLAAITHPQTPQLTATRYQRTLKPLA